MANETTRRGSAAAGEESVVKPPIPRFMYGIVNPVMKAILRSPLHGLMSGSLMVLSFQGRKSGRRLTVPVGYVEHNGALVVFSHSSWWKNFRGGAPVTVRLRGRDRRGTAMILEDPEVIRSVVASLVVKRGEAMARRMGLIGDTIDSPPHRGTVFVSIRLHD
jgi:hypothetical protein